MERTPKRLFRLALSCSQPDDNPGTGAGVLVCQKGIAIKILGGPAAVRLFQIPIAVNHRQGTAVREGDLPRPGFQRGLAQLRNGGVAPPDDSCIRQTGQQVVNLPVPVIADQTDIGPQVGITLQNSIDDSVN